MDEYGRTRRRRIVVALAPVLVGLLVAFAPLVLSDRLPDRAWGDGGYSGFLSWTRVVVLPLVWQVLAIGFVLAMVLRRNAPAGSGRSAVALGWGAAAFSLLFELSTVTRNLDLTGPPARSDQWWGGSTAMFVLAVLAGALGWLVAGRDPVRPATSGRPGPHAPRMSLATGERVLWTRSVVARPALVIAGLWLVLAAVEWWAIGTLAAPALFVVLAVVTAVQAWARVRVDAHGVRVEQPLLRRTLTAAPLDEVVEATGRTVGPEHLPWSAYGVLRRPGVSGYRATRSGEALHLDLSGDREFLVTVPDAGTAAALVNTELDRRRTVDPAC
ncbi:MAG: hypothetical protein ABW212_20005 [Pseudonocardia sediminis]